MSRCFPFPPPGYEKKARLDVTDLLKKEKDKERKHKKDKDKEKRESKEKRDKDGSKEKSREKKDRKEKRKDKEKDKDKSRISDEKKVEGQTGYSNGAMLGSNSSQNSEIADSVHMEELARRSRVEDKASGSHMVPKIIGTDQRRLEARQMVVERDQRAGEAWGMVLERSIGNKSQEKERGVYNNTVADRSTGYQSLEKESAKVNNEGYRKVNGQTNHMGFSGMEKPFGQNLFGMDQQRFKPGEKKDAEKQMEGKEKNKHKESDGNSDKHKSRDTDKHKKSKDKSKDEKKKKTKEITQPSKDQPKIKENINNLMEGSKGPLDFRDIKSSEAIKLTTASPATESNLGKRKELGRNGYILENENRPNKVSRPVFSSNPVAENGKKLEPCQNAVRFGSEKQVLANNHKVDIKDQKINGLIKPEQKINGLIKSEQKINGMIAQPHKSPMESIAVGIPAQKNGETFTKPPHPDTKYLCQILSIPEVEELPDADDQEWLFGCNQLHSAKPIRSPPGSDGMQQVWAETLRIESADIAALPYVIPY